MGVRRGSFSRILAMLVFAVAVSAVDAISPTLSWADPCPSWRSSLETLGTITEPALTEISGLVASTDHPGVFWLIEDSSNGPNLWAINTNGDVVGQFMLGGANNLDWEDIAMDRLPGTDEIYIPDIGDLKSPNRDGVHRIVPTLYRLPEPVVSASQPKVTATITAFDHFDFRYADEAGSVLPPLNAETFMVDPVSHRAFVIEKTGHTVNGRNQFWVFELPSTLSATSLNLATKVSYVTKRPVAGDISGDGRTIVTKGYKMGYLWPMNGTVEQTFDASPQPPCLFSPVDRAEGLAYTPEGLWMIAEGVSAPVHRLAPG